MYLIEARLLYISKVTPNYQERWLDWVLTQILDKSVDPASLNMFLRKDLFAILSSVFIKEIQNISEANPNEDCSGETGMTFFPKE